jgi:hypothetical protein
MPSSASRDRGLTQLSRGTRYLAAGAVVVGGILSAAVAWAHPGKAATLTPTNSPTAGQSNPDNSSNLGQPAQLPQQSFSPPVASSGGS